MTRLRARCAALRCARVAAGKAESPQHRSCLAQENFLLDPLRPSTRAHRGSVVKPFPVSPLKPARTPTLLSLWLVVVLAAFGGHTARAGAAASKERHVRLEQRAQPTTVSMLSSELKSFARKPTAPLAPDLLDSEGWTFSPDLPHRASRVEAIAASGPAALELGPARTRGPPATL